MHVLKRFICIAMMFGVTSTYAETPSEIFHEMDTRKRASFEGIDNFSQMKTIMGMCTLEHFEKARTTSSDGRGVIEYMRLVPLSEISARKSPDSEFSRATPEELDYAADVLGHDPMTRKGGELDRHMESELQSAGLPGGLGFMLTHPPANEPWLSPMPSDMLGNYSLMLKAGAEGKREDTRQKAAAEQEAKTDPFAEIASHTRVVGRETVNGRPAIRLIADNIRHTEVTNGQEFTLKTLHLWVDAEHYVPLKMQMDGTARDGNELRDVRIEREDESYQKDPGCRSLYEPHRSVTRIAGILNAEEEAQMQQAQAQMAEFEAQMASMPQAQRDMIMRQMGPQMEMMKSMAAGNGLEMVAEITGLRCNAGFPSEEEYMLQTAPGMAQGTCIGFVGQGRMLKGSAPAGNIPPADDRQAPRNERETRPDDDDDDDDDHDHDHERMSDDSAREKQQACLEEKVAAAQASQKKKRGFGRLMSAVTRTAGSFGNHDIAEKMGDVYSANATADDLAAAAKDLGLTEDDIVACKNPT